MTRKRESRQRGPERKDMTNVVGKVRGQGSIETKTSKRMGKCEITGKLTTGKVKIGGNEFYCHPSAHDRAGRHFRKSFGSQAASNA